MCPLLFALRDAFVQFDTTRADGQYRKPASNKKVISLMGGFQFTPFPEGEFYHRHAGN